MKQPLTVPHDPQPLAPLEGEVVDGSHVLLRWKAAESADRYCVQIATGSDFRDVIFEQEVPGAATSLVVLRHFPEDGQAFYWRVLAGKARGWSEGEHIEAFTSSTAAQAARFAVPDLAEPLGPIAALFSAAALEAFAEVLPGRQPRIEQALGEEHPEGVEAAEVLNVEFGLVVAAALIVGALLFILFSAC